MNFERAAGDTASATVKTTSNDNALLVIPIKSDGTEGLEIDVMAPNIDASCYIGKSTGTNGGDFVVAYTAATQLTLSSFPGAITALYAADIEAIRQINAAGTVVATYHRDDATMLMAGAVLTVTGAAFTNTDKFIVFTNIPRPASSGAGGAGGGSIVYTNMSGDFTATPTNGAATITITGLPFTLEPGHVALGSIKKKAVTTNVITTLIPSTISVSGGVITLGGITNFATGDEVYVTLIGPDKAYDTSLDNTLVAVQNPDYAHTTSVETLVAETAWPGLTATTAEGTSDANTINLAGGFPTAALVNDVIGYKVWSIVDATWANVLSWTSANSIETVGGTIASWASDTFKLPVAKRYEINMDTYNFLTLHWRLYADANTSYVMKIYGTLDASATVDADTNWVDMSIPIFGASAIYADGIAAGAAITVEGVKAITEPVTMLKYMIKIVAEGKAAAASGSSATMYIKKSS